jgi:hypothetical protein
MTNPKLNQSFIYHFNNFIFVFVSLEWLNIVYTFNISFYLIHLNNVVEKEHSKNKWSWISTCKPHKIHTAEVMIWKVCSSFIVCRQPKKASHKMKECHGTCPGNQRRWCIIFLGLVITILWVIQRPIHFRSYGKHQTRLEAFGIDQKKKKN